MKQTRLLEFDPLTEATNPYVEAVLHLWPEEDKQAIARAIMETAENLEEFTADDVRERYPFLEGMRPNSISAMFSALHRRGFIRSTGRFVMSDRPARHRSVHRVWRANFVEEKEGT